MINLGLNLALAALANFDHLAGAGKMIVEVNGFLIGSIDVSG